MHSHEKWRHHKGPYSLQFIEDASQRSKTRISRRSTLLRKAHELHVTTGDVVTLIVQKDNGDTQVYASDSNIWKQLNEGGLQLKHVGDTKRVDFEDQGGKQPLEKTVATVQCMGGELYEVRHTQKKMRVISAAVGRPEEDAEEEAERNVIDIPIEPEYPTPSKASTVDANFIKTTTPLAKPLLATPARHPPPPAVPTLKRAIKEPARKRLPLVKSSLRQTIDKLKSGISQQPGTSLATSAPGTSATPAPGTSATPAPGTSATPAPGTSAKPAPGTSSARPAPGTSSAAPAVMTPGIRCIVCNDLCASSSQAWSQCLLGCGAACHVACGHFGHIQGFVCSECSIHLAVDDGNMARSI